MPRNGNGRPHGQQTLPLVIKAEERRAEALSLRKAGLSHRAIGEALGITPQSAHTMVVAAIREISREAAEDVLVLELERLDDLYNAALPYALGYGGEKVYENGRLVSMTGGLPPDPVFMGRCLEIMARRAKYLGLDAPVRMELVDAEAERLSQLTGIPADVIKSKANKLLSLAG